MFGFLLRFGGLGVFFLGFDWLSWFWVFFFLVKKLYKFSIWWVLARKISNSDVPVISNIAKVHAPFFWCAYYCPLAREYDIRDIFKVTKIKALHGAENTCQTLHAFIHIKWQRCAFLFSNQTKGKIFALPYHSITLHLSSTSTNLARTHYEIQPFELCSSKHHASFLEI